MSAFKGLVLFLLWREGPHQKNRFCWFGSDKHSQGFCRGPLFTKICPLASVGSMFFQVIVGNAFSETNNQSSKSWISQRLSKSWPVFSWRYYVCMVGFLGLASSCKPEITSLNHHSNQFQKSETLTPHKKTQTAFWQTISLFLKVGKRVSFGRRCLKRDPPPGRKKF